MLAHGKGAHYPILSGVVSDMVATYPDAAKDVGLFALPGDDASKNGLTVWTPGGVYIPTTTDGRQAGRGQEVPRLRRQPGRLQVAGHRRRPDRPVRGQGLRAAGRRAAGDQGHAAVPRQGRRRPAWRWSSCRRSRARRWSRSPSRWAPASARPRTAPPCTTRTSRSRPSNSAWRAGEVHGRSSRACRLRTGRRPGRRRPHDRHLGSPGHALRQPRPQRRPGKIYTPYSYWFYLPAAVIYGVLFLVPTFASFYFSLTRWTPVRVQVHRPGQLRHVLPGAGPGQGLHQHADLRRGHLRRRRSSSACCSPCC